jgi:plastocyanin
MKAWKWIYGTAAVVLAVSLLVTRAGATGSGASKSSVSVDIVGAEKFLPNRETSTYRFPDAPIKVASGGTITFNNQTIDSHTVTLVAPGDLAKSFNCPVCDAVDGVYFPGNGNGPPAGAQIDAGTITDDDSQADTPPGDAPDGPQAGAPFPVLIEDFDTVSHSNPSAPPTVGDSTFVFPNPNPFGAPIVRTVQVTAPSGTVLHYMCTIHPWMQGQIDVQ